MKDGDDDDDGDGQCTKNYDRVSRGRGNCFLMLASCLKCEHVLGGHLIRGSEGRCDVLNSLVMAMPNPPAVVVYDNACNLSASARRWAPEWASEMTEYV